MGMIFNSAKTLEILEKLNARYSKVAKHGHEGDSHTISDGQAIGHKIYKISSDLQIDLDTPSTTRTPNRWEKYLLNLDNYFDPLHPSVKYTDAILNALKAFLGDPKCLAIEFYAVEGSSYDLKISLPDPNGGDYFAYILVQSLALSQTISHVRLIEGLPAKGARSRDARPEVRVPGSRRKPQRE